MRNIYLFSISCSILILIVEAKPCPEKTRPHKTRCEAFYKCVDLPPKRHVWIPELCQEGLVYEHEFRMCVLPPDDWDCQEAIDEYEKKKTEQLEFSTLEKQNLIEDERKDEAVNLGDNNFEGSGDNEIVEQKQGSTELNNVAFSNIDPKFTKKLQRLSQLVQEIQKEQEMKQTADLGPHQLNMFLTNFNKNYKSLNSTENYVPAPISSTTPAPNSIVENMELQLPYPNEKLKPETKLLLSNIFGYPNYAKSQYNSAFNYNRPSQSQETPNISAETLKTVFELSKQLVSSQNLPKILPNMDYYKQAIIQPVIIPAAAFPLHNNFFNFPQRRPNNKNKQNYKRNPNHTFIHNNVHIAVPSTTSKNTFLDSYGYPPLGAEAEISVTTALPFRDFQVTPQTIAKFYTPSPYLDDETANNLFLTNKYTQLFPTQIDPSKIKIRPNAQHYDSLEIDSNEYGAQQFSQYLLQSTTTTRPAFDGAQMVHFGGNFVPIENFRKKILPLLDPGTDLSQVEFIQCITGVRQANATDCTRYYVCSKKNAKVLSYACPPYTAFNALSRVCDAASYAACVTPYVSSSYGDSNNMLRLQTLHSQALLKMLQQRERERLRKETESVFSGSASSTTTTTPTTSKPKKKKYYCKEGAKVADQNSSNSYFVCFKNSQGHMKGHKMTCPNGLIFCAASSICTLNERCK